MPTARRPFVEIGLHEPMTRDAGVAEVSICRTGRRGRRGARDPEPKVGALRRHSVPCAQDGTVTSGTTRRPRPARTSEGEIMIFLGRDFSWSPSDTGNTAGWPRAQAHRNTAPGAKCRLGPYAVKHAIAHQWSTTSGRHELLGDDIASWRITFLPPAAAPRSNIKPVDEPGVGAVKVGAPSRDDRISRSDHEPALARWFGKVRPCSP
jgi:hypothetical protein